MLNFTPHVKWPMFRDKGRDGARQVLVVVFAETAPQLDITTTSA